MADNEFFIGSSAPMIERRGISAGSRVDKTIQGAPNPSFGTASNPIADVFFATKLGLLQKCIGVQWLGKKLVFVEGGGDFTSIPLVLIGVSAGSGLITTSAGVGQDLKTNPSFTETLKDSLGFGDTPITTDVAVGTQAGGGAIVGIHGKVKGEDVYVIGGRRVEAAASNSFGSITTTEIAFIASSRDGKNWTAGSCPTLPVITGTQVIDPFAGTFLNHISYGAVTALGFDPKTETFYCTVAYTQTLDDGGNWQLAFCSSSDGSTFSGGFEVVFSISGTQQGGPTFPLPPWPDTTRVNDYTIPYQNQGQGIVNISNTWKYASVNAPGQFMKIDDNTTLRMGGSNVFGITPLEGINSPVDGSGLVSATTDGAGIVAVVQYNPTSAEAYLSTDSGNSFTPFATEFTESVDATNSSLGTLSFS